MTTTTPRSLRHGIAAGVAAGVLLAVFEVLAALALGMSWLTPFRMFASVVLGDAAMDPAVVHGAAAVVTGALVHLGLSSLFGAIYGLLNGSSSLENRSSWERQLALGAVFGVLLWIVNFQLIARNFYPWFLSPPQVLQLVLHAALYGVPLGLFYASAERHLVSPAQRSAG